MRFERVSSNLIDVVIVLNQFGTAGKIRYMLFVASTNQSSACKRVYTRSMCRLRITHKSSIEIQQQKYHAAAPQVRKAQLHVTKVSWTIVFLVDSGNFLTILPRNQASQLRYFTDFHQFSRFFLIILTNKARSRY